MPKRIVFLMSDTGGGHRASASALAEALHRVAGNAVSCQLVDLLAAYSAWPLSWAPRIYQPLVDYHPWLWRILWWCSEQRLLLHGLMRIAQVWQAAGLRRFAADFPADLYVSVHPLLNHVPRQALRLCYPNARFATVVTDLDSAGRLWFDPGVDLLSASCPAVQQAALRAGVPSCKVRLFGLPVRLQFGQARLDTAQARARLGLEQRPTVLLLGGGAGIGALAPTAAALAPVLATRGGQLAVICGHNDRLRRRLAGRSWPMPVAVRGYVDNMHDWMAAADLVVTKAGPGTIAEALAWGLPLVISSYVPGQETGNVAYVERHGVGVYRSNPQQIAAVVAAWLEPGNPALTAMRQQALALARPEAALDIASALAALLE